MIKIMAHHCYQIILWTIILITLTDSIRIVRYFNQIQPEHQPSSNHNNIEYVQTLIGANLTLNCKVILEQNDRLYSMKWYRKHNGSYYEFYSFISIPNQTIHYHQIPGLHLDNQKQEQNGESIHLINVNLSAEGLYKCEAISDEMFQVDRKEFKLIVLVPPMSTPKIIFSRDTFRLGERVELKCISGLSRPVPQIKWFINNVHIPEHLNWTSSAILNASIIDDQQRNNLTTFTAYETINHLVDKPNKQPKPDQWPSSTTTSKQSRLSHETMNMLQRNISTLNFILRREHLVNADGWNHFSVACVSLMETKFYPQQIPHSGIESKRTIVNWKHWSLTHPIIEGLQHHYQIGDVINVRCFLPNNLFTQNQIKNKKFRKTFQWTINQNKITSSLRSQIKIFNDRKGRYSRLCFRLGQHHLDKFGSFQLKCTIKQKYVSNDNYDDVDQTMEQEEFESNISSLNNNSNDSLFHDLKHFFVQQKPTEKMMKSFGAALVPMAAIILLVIMAG